MLHSELTEKIIECFYIVYNTLGHGFLEKVYENALVIELQKCGMNVEKQKNIQVHYDDQIVGDYFADILVDNSVILELKACESISKAHEYQLINYLKATRIEVGLLINFGKEPEFKRKVFSNDRKDRTGSKNGTRMTRIGRINADKRN
jgi:GxxExxY protein